MCAKLIKYIRLFEVSPDYQFINHYRSDQNVFNSFGFRSNINPISSLCNLLQRSGITPEWSNYHHSNYKIINANLARDCERIMYACLFFKLKRLIVFGWNLVACSLDWQIYTFYSGNVTISVGKRIKPHGFLWHIDFKTVCCNSHNNVVSLTFFWCQCVVFKKRFF